MKVIVTGAAGFIGSHVAAFLVNSGHDVLILDDLSGGSEINVPPGSRFVKISVNDNLNELFADFQPYIVYHLAAYAAEGLSHHIPIFNYQNNVLGTVNVLNAASRAGAKYFVFTSSIAAYGHPHAAGPFDESTPCRPCDPYGIAKLACEYHIKSFAEYYENINYTIFRPHNVFGPNQNIADPYRNVVGIFMAKAIQNLPMPIFGNGNQTRSFSYINVVAECIATAPFIKEAVNETFNIGGDESMTVKKLAEKISKIYNVPLNIEWLPVRNEVQHAHCKHEKARMVFAESYKKYIPVAEGLQLMAESLKDKPIPPVTNCPSPIEIIDKMPVSWLRRQMI